DAQILVRQGPVIFDIGEGHASSVVALDVGDGADAGRRLALVGLPWRQVRRGGARRVSLGQRGGGFGYAVERRRGGPERRPRIFDERQRVEVVGDLRGGRPRAERGRGKQACARAAPARA